MTEYKNYDVENHIDTEMWEEICHELDPYTRDWMRESDTLRDLVIKMSKHQYVCCICLCERYGFGNNAQPVRSGICCFNCNLYAVIPARMKQHFDSKK